MRPTGPQQRHVYRATEASIGGVVGSTYGQDDYRVTMKYPKSKMDRLDLTPEEKAEVRSLASFTQAEDWAIDHWGWIKNPERHPCDAWVINNGKKYYFDVKLTAGPVYNNYRIATSVNQMSYMCAPGRRSKFVILDKSTGCAYCVKAQKVRDWS